MNLPTWSTTVALCSLLAAALLPVRAAEMNPAPPRISTSTATNGKLRLEFPYPATREYRVFSSPDAASPLAPDPGTGILLGPGFTVTNNGPGRLYQVSATPLGSNELLTATVLNRLAYGPTPDELDYVRAIGPDAYIAEQLAAESIPDTIDSDFFTNAPPAAAPLTNWIRVSMTAPAINTNIFLYLLSAGRAYIDDVRMVVGTNADVGTNLLVNGDFEDPVLTNGWIVASIYSGSRITNSPTVDGQAASGTNCLLLVGSSAGSGNAAAVQQPWAYTNPPGTVYTISFSYLPLASVGTAPITNVVRVSGATTNNVGLNRTITLPWLGPIPPTAPPSASPIYAKLNVSDPITNSTTTLDDLRAYHVYRAIHSKRQLHETLLQFFQNHFTTQYQKTYDYFDAGFSSGIYSNDSVLRGIAVDLHWREYRKFRDALLNPQCNFYDLLKISIESPAMVIYLDTILNSRTAPNQNYAREILELHTMGADNGYTQQDIIEMAKVWTGWRVDKKVPASANNVFATAISRSNPTNFADTPGIWVLHYNANVHDSNSVKRLFTNVVVDARFGASLGAGSPYALTFTNGAAAAGTNGFAEGQIVTRHLADLPYTMEYVSVKLCQLFVHEDFEHGVYDYTAPSLSPEAALVKACMTAWNTPASDGRKGNIRSVLSAIFSSDLFRGHGASRQKVKTPLEYTVSAVRALRVTAADTNAYVTSTCDSDGYGISGLNGNTYPLSRMGAMGLFNKAEPDGWSEKGSIWLNTANLCERMRFVEHLLMPATGTTLKTSDYGTAGSRNTSEPAALVRLRLPSTAWNNPGAVVDLFLDLIFPGEGAGNLGIDRQSAIEFLNTDDAGAVSAFNLVSHERRLRGMVGFLLSLPRFHEQ
ncbi:MAG: hypothetical protein RJA22_1736 [Verrucomicrobiota bacterium]